MKSKIQQKSGQIHIVEVKDINELKVTLDANHPFAGKDLIFDIELIEIV
jgi:FKBP-type peptidyl-prolyl cis-trans isomerase 2